MADGDIAPRARVLVAEDDRAMRDVIVQSLESEGYEVNAVADGALLLVALARRGGFHYRRVDLVLADVRMPLCSGLDVLDAFYAARVRPRFVLMSAFPDREVVERAALLGVPILEKPFRMARLHETLAHALSVPHIS